MSERSAIEWTDSTFNPWMGCTKVGPGCDHCYAEALIDQRYGKAHWGAGQPRVRTSAANWHGPVAWNRKPFFECLDCGARFAPPDRKEGYITCPGCSPLKGKHAYDEEDGSRVKQARRRVFCASLADVFDNEVNPQWRADLLDLIVLTPNLNWLLLTKRIGNVERMMPRPPPNVWLGATMVNQDELERDAEKLLAIPAAVHFISYEPALGPLDARAYLGAGQKPWGWCHGLSWVICGGESGAHARPMHPDWARALRDQCQAAGVPFLFKQWGEFAPWAQDASQTVRVGKKAAGRLIDGREWNGFPT